MNFENRRDRVWARTTKKKNFLKSKFKVGDTILYIDSENNLLILTIKKIDEISWFESEEDCYTRDLTGAIKLDNNKLLNQIKSVKRRMLNRNHNPIYSVWWLCTNNQGSNSII